MAYARFKPLFEKSPMEKERERVINITSYIRVVNDSIRLEVGYSAICMSLGKANPYAELDRMRIKYACERSPRVHEALRSVEMRLRKHSKGMIPFICRNPHILDKEERALSLLVSLRVMDTYEMPYELTNEIKQKLVLAKLRQ